MRKRLSPTVIGDIRRVVPEAEILVVDSSTDRTAEIAEELGARVIKQFPPRGYGPAMDTALRSGERPGRCHARLRRYLPRRADPGPGPAGPGGRLRYRGRLAAGGKPQAMPWLNYLANCSFALLASLLFLRRVTDLHSGMRAYRKSLIDELELPADGAALPVELLLRPLKMGKRFRRWSTSTIGSGSARRRCGRCKAPGGR